MNNIQPKQILVLLCALAACVMAVIGFLIVSGANEGESLDTALMWMCGGIFIGGIGLGLTQVP